MVDMAVYWPGGSANTKRPESPGIARCRNEEINATLADR